MAVGRVNGAREGVEDYLEYGQKQGQEHTRDELDERIILEGDLDITREVIAGMDNLGDKYLHYTFSFKEKDIPLEKVKESVEIIKNFFNAAYFAGELDFYAELQLPKIQTALDKTTGEVVDRYPHIHIVVSKTNLITGEREDPLGLVRNQIVFLDALQEYINAKLGLASPKDNVRQGVSHSDIIARNKNDDQFQKGSFKAVMNDIRGKIASGEIESYDALKEHLAKVGQVKVTNAGKEKEYLGIKLPGKNTFVNLREQEFRRPFFDLLPAAQRDYLGAHKESVLSAGIPKKTLPEYEDLLNQWHTRRAMEVRFLNSGGKQYREYKEMSPEERQAKLAELMERARQRVLTKENDYATIRQSSNARGINRQASAERTASVDQAASRGQPSINRQPNAGKIGSAPPPAARRDLLYMSSCPVASQSRRDPGVLPGHVYDYVVEPGRQDVRQGVRWAKPPITEVEHPVTGRTSDNAAAQFLRDVRESTRQNQGAEKADIQEIKIRLDARRLLADLSCSHRLQLADYVISKGADGGDRIRHKDERVNHNVSDFLTKRIHLPWSEAQPYLQAAYAKQLEQAPVREGRQRPDADLWKAFQSRRNATYQEDRKAADAQKEEAWQAQKASEHKRRAAIKDRFYKEKSAVWSNKSLGKAERKAQMSIIQMAKVEKEAALREVVMQERAALKAESRRKLSIEERYKSFLRTLAEEGNQRALLELRRQRDMEEDAATEVIRRAQRKLWIDSADKKDGGDVLQGEGMRYKIHRSGDVVYSRFGKDLLIDRGSQVDMLDTSEETIERGLRLSAQKWGGRMKLHGSAEFIDQAIRIAADRGMKITFNDPEQQRLMEKYQAEREKQRELIAAGQRFTREQAALAAKDRAAAKTPSDPPKPIHTKPTQETVKPASPVEPKQPSDTEKEKPRRTSMPTPTGRKKRTDDEQDR